MMVVRVGTLLGMTILQPHEEMRKRNRVEVRSPKSIVIFVSHQWLARSHPDPDSVQLQCLQRFLVTVGQGQIQSLFSKNGWIAFKDGVAEMEEHGLSGACRKSVKSCFQRRDAPEQLLVWELASSFFWIDYICIPQEHDVTGEDDSQLRAILSIPWYVEQSSFFFVLCPSAKHRDTKEVCDYRSWQQRGWCRFEKMVDILSRHRAASLILTEARVQPFDPAGYIEHGMKRGNAPGCGAFSCCSLGHCLPDGTSIACDKDIVLGVLREMWTTKIDEMSDMDNEWAFVYFKVMETQLFVRSLEEPFRATWASFAVADDMALGLQQEKEEEEDNIASEELVLQRIDEDISTGLMDRVAIHIAASLGDERLLQACIDRGDDPLAATDQGVTALQHACASGSTAAVGHLLSHPAISLEHADALTEDLQNSAMHRAAAPGHVGVVEALLRFRASPTPPLMNGRTPLHRAARHGHAAVVRVLLGAGAPTDAQDLEGATAMHLAAGGGSEWASERCLAEVVQCLKEHGASTAIQDEEGLTAEGVALRGRFETMAELICR